jgi:hypothetical protein
MGLGFRVMLTVAGGWVTSLELFFVGLEIVCIFLSLVCCLTLKIYFEPSIACCSFSTKIKVAGHLGILPR